MAAIGNYYNTLEFGGINSGDYGVYITGTGVYNAPARAVEMVSVPGRNGDVPIDMGHWDNIEVTYKCGLFGIDQSEMGSALMEFRNAIASQIGYQRLSDSYNPNEFRLGLFMAGLEFDAVSMNRAGEFELKFNCKPQRFLTDGEEMIDVKSDWSDLKTASGEVVTFEVTDDAAANYTQFKSLVANIDPIQDLSHEAPSPENICPISGWDSVEASVVGKNLYSDKFEDYTLYEYFVAPIKLEQGATYKGTVKLKEGGTPQTGFTVGIVKYGKHYSDFISGLYIMANNRTTLPNTITRTIDATWTDPSIVIYTTPRTQEGFEAFFENYEVQLEKSQTATEYTPYNGHTHTANFDETVYGGDYDFVGGSGNVTRGKWSLKNRTWYKDSTGFWTSLDAIKRPRYGMQGGMICNVFETLEDGKHYSTMGNNQIALYNSSPNVNVGQNWVYIRMDEFTTTADFKAYIDSLDEVDIVAELAEPRTIQLDPQTINTLVGVNNVWANSGDVSVEYGVRPGVLINPTQYESSPVIEIEGTGDVNLNDYVIAIDGGSVGEVELASERRVEPIMGSSYPSTITETIDLATTMSLLEDGDAFNISTLTASWLMGDTTKETYTITQQPTDGVASIETATSPRVSAVARFSQLAFVKGEAKTFAEEFIISGRSSHGTGSVTFTVGVDYDGSHTLTISYGVAIHPSITGVLRSGSYSDIGEIVGDSSKQTFSGQVIIDSETGDAYRIEDGTYISLNKYIQLGAQLPTLRPGANIITYDDTITSLNIAPRWWRL